MAVFERPYLQSPGHRKPLATQYSGVCSCKSLSVSRHYVQIPEYRVAARERLRYGLEEMGMAPYGKT
jgi:hypothetical protein